ncbi:MAG: Thioredoxin reductase [bacterium ADurb.Bin400]|nr:MAG: Thioredoxin reductase [bacterium ADurb.Bin400]
MDKSMYDIVIVGMGPAGYTASIYASRYKLKNQVIGKLMGGLIGESHKVCNYPTEDEISGLELMMKMQQHAKNLGASELYEGIVDIQRRTDGTFCLTTEQGNKTYGRSVLLATGLKHRTLNVPGEQELRGRGVAYCATCDGFFYRNKTVAVIGGGDSALSAAVYLSEIAKKVYLIYRGEKLRGEPAWIDLLSGSEKVEILCNTNVTAIHGTNRVERIDLDQPYNGASSLNIDGIFIEIGAEPDRTLISSLGLETDSKGYVVVGPDQSTSLDGVYAAGDITTASNYFKQVITASSEGAIAAQSIFSYLSRQTGVRTSVETAKTIKVRV